MVLVKKWYKQQIMFSENEKENIKNILLNDGVIAFVTDTVWGLGCLPSSEKAVKKIYQIKNREAAKPLILMSNEIYNLFPFVKPIPMPAQRLIKEHFPGALTVVLDKSPKTPDFITSGMKTVGIRVPNNQVFAEICKIIPEHVLATTSANVSHEPPALSYEEAESFVGNKVDYVVQDYGCKTEGLASTVIGFVDNEIKIFRQGAVVI